jgi:hypothetical protein
MKGSLHLALELLSYSNFDRFCTTALNTLLLRYPVVVALLGLAAVYCGLFFYFVLRFSLLSLEAGGAGVCCVCAGVHRAPQQPLPGLYWLLPKAKRSSAYTCVLG